MKYSIYVLYLIPGTNLFELYWKTDFEDLQKYNSVNNIHTHGATSQQDLYQATSCFACSKYQAKLFCISFVCVEN